MIGSAWFPLAYPTRNSWTRSKAWVRAVLIVALFAIVSGIACRLQAQTHPAPQVKANIKSGQPVELTVFAASDMKPVLEVLGPYFERRTGIKLKTSFGSSSALSQQINNGAPADLFLSADFLFAEQIVASGKADSKDPTPYAKGVLVLWERKDGPFQPLSMSVLQRKDIKSIAIANPDVAPYGRASIAALKKLNYFDNVVPHFVQAESVGQAAQFALSGNTQLALISETIAMSGQYKQAGSFVLFPLASYLEIRQCAVVMKDAPHRTEAHLLLNYLTSNEIQQHLPQLGLQPVQ